MKEVRLDEARRALDRRGYCVLDKILEDGAIAELHERVVRQADYERAIGAAGIDHAQGDNQNQYVYALINKGAAFLALLESEPVNALVAHVLGPTYLLSANDAVIAAPGSREMPLHTDQWWLPAARRPDEPPARAGAVARFGGDVSLAPAAASGPVLPPVVCSVMWPITDFSEANGATRLVPGSHLSGAYPDGTVPHRIASVPAEAKAGQAIVFDGRLWHATGANRTDVARIGVLTTYCGPQFRQMENYPLMLRDEVYGRASNRLKAILGFKVWEGYGKLDRPDVAMIAPDSRLVDAYDRRS
jgi:ectoine hydroxylase-related dioxygenase (phytanoyl-CoA dioxygenase family)